MKSTILEQIWSGTLRPQTKEAMSPVARSLSSLLAVPTVSFVVTSNYADEEPYAWIAGAEVYPGASLSEILFEEYGLEVSDDTVVLVETRDTVSKDWISKDSLAETISDLLASIARRGGRGMHSAGISNDTVVPFDFEVNSHRPRSAQEISTRAC